MDWQETKASILHQRSPGGDVEKLGEGDEAEVYGAGPEHVIRISKEPTDRIFVRRRREFYASLERTKVSFELPFIVEQNEFDGVCYSVERRIAGSSLADVLLRLDGPARRRALLAYAETAVAIRQIGHPGSGFGELVADPGIHSPTWEDFVLRRASLCLSTSHGRLSGHVHRPDRALACLGDMLVRRPPVQPDLVHGDYYPANVLIGEDQRITGVIDFGRLTLKGDACMDAAGAVLYLTGMAGVTTLDKEVVFSCLQSYGLTEEDVALYRLFYAFRFLETTRTGLLRWCIDTIRRAS